MNWWLSFVDPKRPKGERFLGVAVITNLPDEADNIAKAAAWAWRLGLNPGGEVAGHTIPDNALPTSMTRRLLDKGEANLAARMLNRGGPP